MKAEKVSIEEPERIIEKPCEVIKQEQSKTTNEILSLTPADSDQSNHLVRLLALLFLATAIAEIVAVSRGIIVEWTSRTFERFKDSEAFIDLSIAFLFFVLGFILWNWGKIRDRVKAFGPKIFLLLCSSILIATFLIRPTTLYWIGLVIITFVFLHFEYYRATSKYILKERPAVDDPLVHPNQDTLGRSDFAKNLLRLIKDLSKGTARIALIGEWGSGKTTCLNFVKYYAEQSGYPVAFFSPWQFRDTKEAWEGFVNAVDSGMARWHGTPVGPIKRRGLTSRVTSLSSSFLSKIIGNETVGELFNNLIQARVAGSLDVTKERVAKIIQEELGDKPLIVFIDDLDRSQWEVVYEYFLLIKEIIDVRQCIFVCAFDINSIRKALASKFEDVDLFLEKIFHWTYELPQPTMINREGFLKSESELWSQFIKQDILSRWKSLWPTQNPRQLKLFLRHIASLHAVFLRRFSDDDLNWNITYIIELLKFEYPVAAEAIITEPSFPLWLSRRNTFIGTANENEEWKESLEKKELIKDQAEQARFFSIVTSLAEACALKDPQPLTYYFRVLSHPEVLTWKEYRRWYKVFRKKRSPDRVVRIMTDPKVAVERRREFLRALMRERYAELWREANASIHEDRILHLARASDLTEDCLWLAELIPLFQGENPVFNDEVMKEWIEGLIRWQYFRAPFYKAIRKKERRLLLKVAVMSSEQASKMLYTIRPHQLDRGSTEEVPQTVRTLNRVYRIWKRSLSKQLLARFSEQNGISKLWEKNKGIAEKALLFEPNPFFFEKANIADLEVIAEKAKENRIIQENFVELTSMLFYASVSNSAHNPFNPPGALRVLSNAQFREMIWQAATCLRLHRRTVGSLLESRKNYIVRTGQTEVLPIPEWVKQEEPDLIEKYDVKPDDKDDVDQ